MNKIVLIITLFINVDLSAQLKPLSIGDKVPNIPLSEGRNFKLGKSSISDFKGQLVILDFWATWCGSCVSALPKLDSLQNEYKDKIQIILVNTFESYEEVVQRLNRLKNSSINKALSRLPMVFDKSIYKKYFPNNALPHYVWIDTNGAVAYITDGNNTIRSNIDKFLNGEVLDVLYKNDFEQKNITGITSLDNDLLPVYVSGFYKYKPNIRKNSFLTDTTKLIYRESYVNKSLLDLSWQFYNDTVFNIRNRTIIEVKNPIIFTSRDGDRYSEKWNRENLFTYEICLSVQDKHLLKLIARKDLERFAFLKFHLNILVEYKEVDCYVMDIENDELLSTREGKRNQLVLDTIISLSNVDIQVLNIALTNALENNSEPIRFISEVGISRKIDIEIIGNLKDFDNLKRQLKSVGLRLERRKKLIPFLVIKDS